MKFRGYCDSPADDRGIYVEAPNREKAIKKMITIITTTYDCDSENVSLYNIDSELEYPESVLHFECGWKGDEPVCWDDNPIVAYKSNTAPMLEWSQKPFQKNKIA